jgi:aldose 1-epimerase
MKISNELWHTKNGKEIYLFTLSNNHIELKVTNLGCTVTAINVLERNIVLGYSSVEEYLEDKYYAGCIVGRFAGRINDASFNIGGNKFDLSNNEKNFGNHLHGGVNGFNRKIFTVSDSGCNEKFCFVKFETISPHLEEGYPGDLHIKVIIELNSNNEITIAYEAHTNSPTHVNLTHHHYFNLGGDGVSGTEQELVIYADEYLTRDENYIPNGGYVPVKGLSLKEGLNEYLVLSRAHPGGIDATLKDPLSELSLDISTTYPCIVLYSGDFLSYPFQPGQGICLETQFFPDTPNHPHFPSTLLMPGNIYFHETKMKISI